MSSTTVRPDTFSHRRRVTWAETDAAGAVDLGNIMRYSMEALEEWFVERLGLNWHELHVIRRIGTPFVRADLELISPVRPSDQLSVVVRVERMGRSSVDFDVIGCSEPEANQRWKGRFKCVFIEAERRTSISIPDNFRAVIEREINSASA